MLDHCSNSPHALCTIEYGELGNHKHANYLLYTPHRDAFNLARNWKLKPPMHKVKAVSSINNVITYMTKEGKLGTTPRINAVGEADLSVNS